MKLKYIIALFLLSLISTAIGAFMKVNSMEEGNILLLAGGITGALALIIALIKVLIE